MKRQSYPVKLQQTAGCCDRLTGARVPDLSNVLLSRGVAAHQVVRAPAQIVQRSLRWQRGGVSAELGSERNNSICMFALHPGSSAAECSPGCCRWWRRPAQTPAGPRPGRRVRCRGGS